MKNFNTNKLLNLPGQAVIQTTFSAPDFTDDKEWKPIPQPGSNVYRFESKVQGRDFLWGKVFSGEVLWGSSTSNNTRWELFSILRVKSTIRTCLLPIR